MNNGNIQIGWNQGPMPMKLKHLFICGASRSGTTFLWKTLNNNPTVNLATEIHYFSSLYHNGFLSNHKKLKIKNEQITLDDLLNSFTKGKHFGMFWELDRSFTAQEINRYFSNRELNEKNIYQFLMEHDLSKKNKPRTDIKFIGEKTPQNIFHIKRLFKWFPDAMILFHIQKSNRCTKI